MVDFAKMNKVHDALLKIIHEDECDRKTDIFVRHKGDCAFVHRSHIKTGGPCLCGKVYDIGDVIRLGQRLAVRGLK